MPPEGMKENYNETIRLGYIALYHKFENFNNVLIKEVDNHFEEIYEKKESFKAFAKRELQVDKWPKISKDIERIGWICNSIKHTDGFPKLPVDPAFKDHPRDKKLVFSKDDLMNDIDKVNSFCESIVAYAVLTASYKVQFEWPREPNQEIEDKLKEMRDAIIRLGHLISDDV